MTTVVKPPAKPPIGARVCLIGTHGPEFTGAGTVEGHECVVPGGTNYCRRGDDAVAVRLDMTNGDTWLCCVRAEHLVEVAW